MFNIPPPKKNRALYSVKKPGTVGQTTDDNTTGRMRIACWVTNTTDKNSEYVNLSAFSRQ